MQKDQSDLEVIIDCDDDGFQDEVVTNWICINNFTLSRADKDIILNGENLSDKHINALQKLLAMQFPTLTIPVKIILQEICKSCKQFSCKN